MTTRKSTFKKPLKKDTTKSTKIPTAKPDPDIQVLAACTTKSVSGSSTLRYQIGIDATSAIHIRVISSSGTGYVNPDWIALKKILDILESHPAKLPFKSSVFNKAIPGLSNNNIGFLTATLIQEKVLMPFGDKDKFKWKYNSADEFLDRVDELKLKKPTDNGA